MFLFITMTHIKQVAGSRERLEKQMQILLMSWSFLTVSARHY